MEYWKARDPITRFEAFLRRQGVEDAFFEEVNQAGDELAADIREQTFALKTPPLENIFDFVYSDSHQDIDQQRAWLKAYEESMGTHE